MLQCCSWLCSVCLRVWDHCLFDSFFGKWCSKKVPYDRKGFCVRPGRELSPRLPPRKRHAVAALPSGLHSKSTPRTYGSPLDQWLYKREMEVALSQGQNKRGIFRFPVEKQRNVHGCHGWDVVGQCGFVSVIRFWVADAEGERNEKRYHRLFCCTV